MICCVEVTLGDLARAFVLTESGAQVEALCKSSERVDETIQAAKERLSVAGLEAFPCGGRLFIREAQAAEEAPGPWDPRWTGKPRRTRCEGPKSGVRAAKAARRAA